MVNATSSMVRRRTLLIIDPARSFGASVDRLLSNRLARSFHSRDWTVEWVVDVDDMKSSCPYATVHRIIAPSRIQFEQATQANIDHIAQLDNRARAIWQDGSHSPGGTTAWPIFAATRVYYFSRSRAAFVWHPLRRAFRSATCWLYLQCCELMDYLAHWPHVNALQDGKPIRLMVEPMSGGADRQILNPVLSPLHRLVCSCRQRFVDWKADRTLEGEKSTLGGSFRKNVVSICGRKRLNSDHERQIDLVSLLRRCGPNDLIVFPAAEAVHLEMLLQLLPQLEIEAPLPTTLHMRFAARPRLRVERGDVDIRTIASRLKSGSPVRTIVLHADDQQKAAHLAHKFKLPVSVLDAHLLGPQREPCCHEDFERSFPCYPHEDAFPSQMPSLVVNNHGPMALVITALWGRVGSSIIFDDQTRYLVERGYIVARVFVEHWPHVGESRTHRIANFVSENFEHVRPHFHFIAERNNRAAYLARLLRRSEFRSASPVNRIQLLLAEPKVEKAQALSWCGRKASVAIVNHVPHLIFAESLTRAPIILETHDIYSDLLTSHGIPKFVPRGPDSIELRRTEERSAWARVAACINLSPIEHAEISQIAKRAALVRPYITKRQSARSWPEFLAANDLPPAFCQTSLFDIMLWGDLHDGNVRGVRWFLNELIPRYEPLQSATIVVAGRVASRLDQNTLKNKNLLVTGFVDRLEDLMVRSRVLVIPDQSGTGISIKAMDAFSLGACFASTCFGVRGLEMGKTGYEPSEDANQLAAEVIQLLGSEVERRKREAIARQLYDLNFSAEAYANALDPILNEVGLAGEVQDRSKQAD